MDPKLLVFASGDASGGGSGFEWLVDSTKTGVLQADIVAVVSNYEHGGVRQKADKMGIHFIYFPAPYTADQYQAIYNEAGKPFVSLSGWLKLVAGLPMGKTINIHPGPLPEYGGKGMYGHFVHEAVMEAFRAGLLTESAVTMHLVSEEFDRGPTVFRYPVQIRIGDTAKTLAARVNEVEHGWQSWVTNLFVTGQIRFEDGCLELPLWYDFYRRW